MKRRAFVLAALGPRRERAFVALGALHLFGKKGVVTLLDEEGYQAERVF